MVLTHDQILAEIQAGNIAVEPFDETAVGPASVDLTLAPEIRIFRNIDHSIPVVEGSDFREITKHKVIEDKYTIKPKELILGITKERVTLAPTICGWLNSRSRFARLGLMVHITAPFIQPGVSNRQVLEIFNAGPNNLEIVPGERLCQLIFQRCEGEAEYQGLFKEQEL
jgi:dCTP deaminase